MEYLDFDVEIQPAREYNYLVTCQSPMGEAKTTMHFPFDEQEMEQHLLLLQKDLSSVSQGEHREEAQSVHLFGRRLFEALISGDVAKRYAALRARANREEKGVRLRLHIEAPDLAVLPWEYLYDTDESEYLCLARNTSLVRYLSLPRTHDALKIKLPLRILGMIACPSGLGALAVEKERNRIEQALTELKAQGLVELVWIEGQTWRDLQEAMWQKPWHIFHFIGHGFFNEKTQEGSLFFADENGAPHSLEAASLGRLLRDHPSLRLVILNACQGAKAGKQNIFSSMGATLARTGIPAVLAMQALITDRTAIEFSRTFYRALAHGMPVDKAVDEARIAINVGNHSLAWGTPVLYLRSSDTVLFDLTASEHPQSNQEPRMKDSTDSSAADLPTTPPARTPSSQKSTYNSIGNIYTTTGPVTITQGGENSPITVNAPFFGAAPFVPSHPQNPPKEALLKVRDLLLELSALARERAAEGSGAVPGQNARPASVERTAFIQELMTALLPYTGELPPPQVEHIRALCRQVDIVPLI